MSSTPARERILVAAMDLFMEHGFAETTTLQIATQASVSKRELYALFGSKQVMLETCIAERGSRMRLPAQFPAPTDGRSLHVALRTYGATMLREISDPEVVAVFRLGIAEAKRSPGIARSLEEMGRAPARAALRSLLQRARDAGLLAPGDLDTMMKRFYGLLWGDGLVWILLGIDAPPRAKEIERRSEEAASVFLAIHGR